jgi:N-acetylmuramoyl-L-alanine amidase
LRFFRVPSRNALRAAAVLVVATLAARSAAGAAQNAGTYLLYASDGRHALPYRTLNNVDFVALDQLASLFGLTVSEDPLVSGLTIRSKGQTILVIPGQSFASIGPGRIVSLPAAIQRDRGSLQVPVEFIRQVLAPALGTHADIRRGARLILFGDVRLPQITASVDRLPGGVRLTIEAAPATPHRVTREGRQVVVRFDAAAIDAGALPGVPAEFATAMRVDGASIVIDLGPSASGFRADDPDPTHLTIDLTAPIAAAAPARPQAPEPPPAAEPPPSGVRTIVIDPGHGGDDAGVTGRSGTKEKDLALQLARRLKGAIEARYGLRVLLTRDADEAVPADKRTALANNNKADLFISLHADASLRADVHGASVLSLDTTDYAKRPEAALSSQLPVAVAGGGSRRIDLVAWDLAELPFAATSADLAASALRHLDEHHVPLFTASPARLPLRVLVGANMPALLVEVGFLTNAGDETALNGAERAGAIVEALADTVNDIRRGPAAPRVPVP